MAQMSLYTAAVTLFLVMDPLGNVPIFISVLNNVDPQRRTKVLVREMLIALGFLLVFLYFGKFILQAMSISSDALSIAGGIILFLIALNMIFPNEGKEKSHKQMGEPFIVPLAIPLVAGPTTMAVLMLFATRQPNHMGMLTTALLIAWVASAMILLSSEFLRKILSDKGLVAVERLMGIILMTMAIQMSLSGIKTFFGL